MSRFCFANPWIKSCLDKALFGYFCTSKLPVLFFRLKVVGYERIPVFLINDGRCIEEIILYAAHRDCSEMKKIKT